MWDCIPKKTRNFSTTPLTVPYKEMYLCWCVGRCVCVDVGRVVIVYACVYVRVYLIECVCICVCECECVNECVEWEFKNVCTYAYTHRSSFSDSVCLAGMYMLVRVCTCVYVSVLVCKCVREYE